MANPNPSITAIVPYQFRAGIEQAKIASKGGKARAAKQREKKLMREAAIAMMSMPVQQDRIRATVKRNLGVDDEDIDNQLALLMAQLNKALKGDTQAATFIRDTMGEAPIKELQVEQVIPQPLAPIKASDAPDYSV